MFYSIRKGNEHFPCVPLWDVGALILPCIECDSVPDTATRFSTRRTFTIWHGVTFATTSPPISTFSTCSVLEPRGRRCSRWPCFCRKWFWWLLRLPGIGVTWNLPVSCRLSSLLPSTKSVPHRCVTAWSLPLPYEWCWLSCNTRRWFW